MPATTSRRPLWPGSNHMNQTSLVGRPLAALTAAWMGYASKRGIWSGPLTSSSPELARLWGAPQSSTGVAVNEETALNYGPVWACVARISTDVASVPLNLYKRLKPEGRELYWDSPLYELLHDEPNSEMGSLTLRETLQAHVLLWGNGYAEIVRNGAGMVSALWPLTPDRVTVRRDPRGQVYYEVSRPEGGMDRMPADDMFHLRGLGFDGLVGYSVIAKMRESIGLGLATEKFGGTFFGNGSTFGGVISLKTPLTPQAQKSFGEAMAAQHQGVDRAHKFLLLGNEAEYARLGIPPNDAQFLETRQFQAASIAQWYGVPQHKIGILDRSTNNNIEHQGIEYVIDTIRSWCVRWEQEIKRKLIPRSERRIQYAEHLIEGLSRGDLGSRYAAYAVGRQWGWLSVDDIRQRENMNPLPNGQGKIYLVPANMSPADRLNEIIDKQVAPTPTPIAPAPTDPGKRDDAEQMVALIQAALVNVEIRIAEHASKVAVAEADAVRWKDSAGEFEAEAATHRTKLADAQAESARLQAVLLEASERADRLALEHEALRADHEDVKAQRVALDQQLSERSAGLLCLNEQAAALTAERDTLQAQCATATVEAEQRTADHVAALATLQMATEAGRSQAEEHVAAHQALVTAAEQERDAKIAALAMFETTLAETTTKADALTVELEALRAQAATAEETAGTAVQEAATVTTERDAAVRDLATQTSALEAERVKSTEMQAATDAQRQAHRTWLLAIAIANRDRLIASLVRLTRVEGERAKRNQGTPAKLKAWGEAFYLDQDDRYMDALREEIRGHLVFIGSTQDVDDYTRALIAPYLQAAVVQVRTIADGDPDDLAVSVERMVSKWERDRPLAIADQIFQEETAHVNTL